MKEQKLIERIPLKDYIAAISVGIVDAEPLLDLTYEEDSRAEVDMNIVMTSKGEFVEVQGTAEGKPFHRAQMNTLINLAQKGIKELIRRQKKILKI
jgi:ribonuclease PH